MLRRSGASEIVDNYHEAGEDEEGDNVKNIIAQRSENQENEIQLEDDKTCVKESADDEEENHGEVPVPKCYLLLQ